MREVGDISAVKVSVMVVVQRNTGQPGVLGHIGIAFSIEHSVHSLVTRSASFGYESTPIRDMHIVYFVVLIAFVHAVRLDNAFQLIVY